MNKITKTLSTAALAALLTATASANIGGAVKDVATDTGELLITGAKTPVQLVADIVRVVVGKGKPSDALNTVKTFTGAAGDLVSSAASIATQPVDAVCDAIDSKAGIAGKAITMSPRTTSTAVKVVTGVANDALHFTVPNPMKYAKQAAPSVPTVPTKSTITVERKSTAAAAPYSAASEETVKAETKTNRVSRAKKRSPWSR